MREWDGFEDNIELAVATSLIKLQASFHRDDSTTCAGMTKLGGAIVALGQILYSMIHEEGEDTNSKRVWQDKVTFGGVLLEALEDGEYIVIDKQDPYSKPGDNRAPLIINATAKWLEVGEVVIPRTILAFTGLSFDRPADVDSLYSNPKTKRPLVKRMNDWSKFSQLKDTSFIRGVNGMQQTAWRINKDVLKAVVDHDWKDVEMQIPKEGNKYLVDQALKRLQTESKLKAKGKSNDFEQAQIAYEFLSEKWVKKKDAQKNRSRIIERKITIEKAKALTEFSEFYYHVEADYRGRIYYAESYLNFQSNDTAKGLLEFSEGKVVTETGYKWMLRHAAASFNQSISLDTIRNVTVFNEDYVSRLEKEALEDIAVDKLSLEDREVWALSNMDLIRTVAHNRVIHPDAEKPVSFLAVCIDIDNYLTAAMGGHSYVSFLPVPVDGSNNGSQHAAAINKDKATGSMVGLTPSAFPHDLYVQVGKSMVKHAPEFFEDRQIPMKDVRKNMSKRSTMVRAYSAGAGSISENMFSDCYKSGATDKYNISAQDCDYLSKIAIKSIDEVCPSNALLRVFLQNLVQYELGVYEWQDEDGRKVDSQHRKLKLSLRDHYRNKFTLDKAEEDTTAVEETISELHEQLKAHHHVLVKGNGQDTLNWVAPSGFQVESKLFIKEEVKCNVSISKRRYTIVGKLDTKRPDKQSHISAIAANFIHAQDASHMAGVIDKWFETGHSSFAGVHDSFSAHASDVDNLVKVTKEVFIDMYDTNTFYEDAVSNILTDSNTFECDTPNIGSLDLNDIRSSDYFFA